MKLHVITFLKMPYLGLTQVCVKSYDVSMLEHSWAHCQDCVIDPISPKNPKITKNRSLEAGALSFEALDA